MPAHLLSAAHRSWNAFGGNLSGELVCSTAKLMRELGLVEAGYRWVGELARDGAGGSGDRCRRRKADRQPVAQQASRQAARYVMR